MEQTSEQPQSQSFLDNPKIKNFLIEREIREDDHELITQLGDFPSDLIIACLHNTFNTYHEDSGRILKVEVDMNERYLQTETDSLPPSPKNPSYKK